MTVTTFPLLAHGGALVLIDSAVKVAVLVAWVLAFALGALILCGIIGIALRMLLGLRGTLMIILPLLSVVALITILRFVANEKSFVPVDILTTIGVPVVALVSFACALLIALPPRLDRPGADVEPSAAERHPGSPGSSSAALPFNDLLTPTSNRTTTSLLREGMTAPLAGFQVMQRYPALWRYAIIPVLLNLLITLLILIGLVSLAAYFSVKLHPRFDPTWTDRLLEAGTILLLIIVAVGGALATWILLNGILCGYFYAKLAREVEIRLGMPPEEMKEITFRHQVIDTFRDLAAVIGINLGVLALNIVPGLGTVIAFPLAPTSTPFSWVEIFSTSPWACAACGATRRKPSSANTAGKPSAWAPRRSCSNSSRSSARSSPRRQSSARSC